MQYNDEKMGLPEVQFPECKVPSVAEGFRYNTCTLLVSFSMTFIRPPLCHFTEFDYIF